MFVLSLYSLKKELEKKEKKKQKNKKIMLMSSQSLWRKEDLDDNDGLSPFDMLAKAICTIASRKIKLLQETQENSDLPLKKRRSYFDFLNTMPSPSPTPTPSNTNTNPNSPVSKSFHIFFNLSTVFIYLFIIL